MTFDLRTPDLTFQVSLSGIHNFASNTIGRAVATIVGDSASIPTATYPSIQISPSQSVTLRGADNVHLGLGAGSSVDVEGGYISLVALAGEAQVTMVARSGSAALGGAGTTADINFVGEDDNAFIYGNSGFVVRMDGPFYQGYMFDGAVGTAYGATVKCEAHSVSSSHRVCLGTGQD